MNIGKQLLKKLGLAVGLLALWVFDDVLMFLDDETVWSLTKSVLGAFKHADRQRYLKAYWTGVLDDE